MKEGAGVYHYTDGSYYEGFFHNDHKMTTGKLHLLDGTVEEQINNEKIDGSKFISEQINAKTEFVEETKEGNIAQLTNSENVKQIITESMDEKIQFSEFKSDIKTLEIGLETLSLIDQIEMMSSLNAGLLKKDCI